MDWKQLAMVLFLAAITGVVLGQDRDSEGISRRSSEEDIEGEDKNVIRRGSRE